MIQNNTFKWAAPLAALSLILSAQCAFAEVVIIGGLSNFDVHNNEDEDCDGFEIEFEDCDEHDISHTYGGSAFGGPVVTTLGSGANRSALVRYHSNTAVVHPGGMTHFGVTLSSLARPTRITYRWTTALGSVQPGPIPLPNHRPQIVDNGTVSFVRNAIHNDQPNNDTGISFWVLPYKHVVNGHIDLEDLRSDAPLIFDSIPLGGGPNGTDPELLDPQDTWYDDDTVEGEANNSDIYWFEVYRDIVTYDSSGEMVHHVGPLITRMIDASLTGDSNLFPPSPDHLTMWDQAVYGSQTSHGTVTMFGTAPYAGASFEAVSSNPAVASVESPLMIPGYGTFVDFPIMTTPVNTPTPVAISISGGGQTVQGSLMVKPPEAYYVTSTPLQLRGGNPFNMRVDLTTPAPVGGMDIDLSATADLVQFPGTLVSRRGTSSNRISMPAGQTSMTFQVKTKKVKVAKTFQMRATSGGVTKAVSVRINP